MIFIPDRIYRFHNMERLLSILLIYPVYAGIMANEMKKESGYLNVCLTESGTEQLSPVEPNRATGETEVIPRSRQIIN